MPIISTENRRISHVIKQQLFPEAGYNRDAVTVNETAVKSYQPGTVLGKVTATGKYKIAVETAVDGSKVGAAIVLEDKSVAANTDTKVLALVRGPAIVSKAALLLDATYDTQAKKDAVYAAFETIGVLVNESV